MKLLAAFIVVLLLCATARAVTTAPSTQPATTQAKVPIAPEARPLIERIRKAYAGDKPLTVEGQIAGDFDVAARQHKYKLSFTAQSDGRGQFVHRAADVGTVVRDALSATVYDFKSNTFGTLKSAAKRAKLADLPAMVTDILEDENPSLLFMLVADPEEALTRRAKRIGFEKDRLTIETHEDRRTIALDDDGYVREMVIDYTPLLRERGAAQIERARVVLTYSRTDRSTPVEASAFDFTIPRGASEFDMEPDRPAPSRDRDRKRFPATTRTAAPTSAPVTSD